MIPSPLIVSVTPGQEHPLFNPLPDTLIIREGAEDDHAFIFDSWLRSCEKDSYMAKPMDHKVWLEGYHPLMEAALARSEVSVVSPLEDLRTILGYIVYEKTELPVCHYIFVKASHRGLAHIASNLLICLGTDEFLYSNETSAAKPHLDRWRDNNAIRANICSWCKNKLSRHPVDEGFMWVCQCRRRIIRPNKEAERSPYATYSPWSFLKGVIQ